MWTIRKTYGSVERTEALLSNLLIVIKETIPLTGGIQRLWWLLRAGSPLTIPNREVKLPSADGTWA